MQGERLGARAEKNQIRSNLGIRGKKKRGLPSQTLVFSRKRVSEGKGGKPVGWGENQRLRGTGGTLAGKSWERAKKRPGLRNGNGTEVRAAISLGGEGSEVTYPQDGTR